MKNVETRLLFLSRTYVIIIHVALNISITKLQIKQ